MTSGSRFSLQDTARLLASERKEQSDEEYPSATYCAQQVSHLPPLRPLQDAARDLASEGEEQHSDEEYPSATTLRRASASSRDGAPNPGGGSPAPPEEVARFGAAKERKHLRSAGIAAFNR